MTPILPLRLDDLVYVRGSRRIIDGVSATIDATARTVVLGPNGAGKSVLLRLCHGLFAPTSGTVVWNVADPEYVRRRQAMVFQRPVMLRRSARGNVEYALDVAGVNRQEREARAIEALERVGLVDLADRPARVLSGGEQQRLALARAWSLRPEVLFLDEPTASLDPGATQEIERIIGAMHASGTKIVLVTHNLGQAKRLADEILFLDRGRLVEHTASDTFFAAPRSEEADRFMKGELPW
ncbi:MAG: phosphate ABC transporter ATP-binding protein [Pseudomonadota bacterium]|nr:phosphate ABC transporter ATP-binding protein [Pseudomonadota bacterium]